MTARRKWFIAAIAFAATFLLTCVPFAFAQQLSLDLGQDDGTLSGRVVQIMLVMTVPFIAIYAIDESGWGAWLDGMTRWQERLLGIAFAMLYYTALEGATGVTLGKLLTGTRVVDEEGRKPTPRQALLLSVSRMVPFEMFSVLLADDDDPRGWHDRWPRTRVVLRSRAKQVLA